MGALRTPLRAILAQFTRPYWLDETTQERFLANTLLFAFIIFVLGMVYSAIVSALIEEILGTQLPVPAVVILWVPSTIAAIVFAIWRQSQIG